MVCIALSLLLAFWKSFLYLSSSPSSFAPPSFFFLMLSCRMSTQDVGRFVDPAPPSSCAAVGARARRQRQHERARVASAGARRTPVRPALRAAAPRTSFERTKQ